MLFPDLSHLTVSDPGPLLYTTLLPNFYPANLQHSTCMHEFLSRVENLIWIHTPFFKKGKYRFSGTRVLIH